MHCYRSRIFDSHLAIPVEVDQRIHESVHFLQLTIQLALIFLINSKKGIIYSCITLI